MHTAQRFLHKKWLWMKDQLHVALMVRKNNKIKTKSWPSWETHFSWENDVMAFVKAGWDLDIINKVKMPVCTSSLSQLLLDQNSKHIMEVASNNMKTDLEHYNKTLPELQKSIGDLHNELCKSELHNELCKSMPRNARKHSLLPEYWGIAKPKIIVFWMMAIYI